MDVVGLCCLLSVQLAFEALQDIKIGNCWCPGSRARWPSACVSCPHETAQADKQSFPHHGLIQVRGCLHPSVGKRRDILCVCHRQLHARVSGLVYTHDRALGASWDIETAVQTCTGAGCRPGLADSIPLFLHSLVSSVLCTINKSWVEARSSALPSFPNPPGHVSASPLAAVRALAVWVWIPNVCRS